jgi:hypothetical protein
MSPTAGQLRRPAAVLGMTGAALLVAAGLIQTTLGAVIPDWTGDKPAPVGLGLLTVGMGAGALLAARRLRGPDLSPGVRAAWALGLVGPGLPALTTVGVLSYLPSFLLVSAGVLAVAHGWRESLRSVVAHWDRVLLSALGCCELLMAAGAAPLAMAVGAVCGTALIVSAWLRTVSRNVRIGLVLLGTLPFAAVGWVAVVPILLVIVAAPLARHAVSLKQRSQQ